MQKKKKEKQNSKGVHVFSRTVSPGLLLVFSLILVAGGIVLYRTGRPETEPGSYNPADSTTGINTGPSMQKTEPNNSGNNLVLLTLDTTRADFLGCYGRKSVKTPNLDRLAEQGVLFEHCTSASPFTLPSHSSILTSQYPYRHGVRMNNIFKLEEDNLTLAEHLKKYGYTTYAIVAAIVLNRTFGTDQGFDFYDDMSDKNSGIRKANEIIDEVINMLHQFSSDRFFIWAHFYDPHFPYESSHGFANDSIEAYEEEISFMDEQIGRMLKELDSLDLSRRTLIAVTADHGEDFGDHELRHGFFVYENTVHVPLIFWHPELIPRKTRILSQARTIDIVPTMLDILSVPPMENIQGHSLVPLIRNDGNTEGFPSYSETVAWKQQLDLSRLRSISDGKWKYILAPEPELYNLMEDPDETTNLALKHPDVSDAMKAKMYTLIKSTQLSESQNSSESTLSSSEIEKLTALGYVGEAPVETNTHKLETDIFEPEGENPGDYEKISFLLETARGAMFENDLELAENLYRQADQLLPDRWLILSKLTMVTLQRKKTSEALSVSKKAVEANPDNYYVLRARGQVLYEAGRLYEAEAVLRRVLEIRKSDIKTLYYLGLIYASRNQLDEAEAFFRVIIEKEPYNIHILHAMGVLYAQRNNLIKAADYFQKALDVDPTYEKARHDLFLVNRALAGSN